MRVPLLMRRLLGGGVRALSPPLLDRMYRTVEPLLPASRRQRLVGEKAQKLGRIMRCGSPSEMYRSLVSVWPDPAALVIGGRDAPGEFERTLESKSPAALLDRIMLADEISYLPDDQFTKVDRASMAVGLEVRVPLVDHRLVEFAWRLPQFLKVREKQGKWLLRQVLYRRVPRALMERPKFGFSVPVAEWLTGPLRPWAEALLDDTRLRREGLLNAPLIRRAWSGLLRGREENALGLWAVLMLQAWQERWAGTPGEGA
jgi:asparagine synthase (glutamine-hydrolysing)